MTYRFVIFRSSTPNDVLHRDLPDDEAAFEWMGREALLPGDRMEAYRDGYTLPFARRVHGGDVEVVR